MLSNNFTKAQISAGIPKFASKNINFNSYVIYDNLQAKLVECLKKYDGSHSFMIISKNKGIGKTHLISTIANIALLHELNTRYIDHYKFNRLAKSISYQQQDCYNKYLECDLLIIDDFNAQFSNAMDTIINVRENNKQFTIIAANNIDDKNSMTLVCKKWNWRFFNNLEWLPFYEYKKLNQVVEDTK